MSDKLSQIWQVLQFGLVGAVAALVHLAVALFVIVYFSLSLPIANVIAFLTAFWVSLLGHHFFSFNTTTLPLYQTFWRFFLVAILGFSINEGCVVILHQLTSVSNGLILITAIMISAVVTFVASRYFAFKIS